MNCDIFHQFNPFLLNIYNDQGILVGNKNIKVNGTVPPLNMLKVYSKENKQ